MSDLEAIVNEDLQKTIDAEADEESARLMDEKETILVRLQALGVAFARGEYDGSWDSGAMERVTLYANLSDYEKVETGVESGVAVIENDEVAEVVSDYLWDVTVGLYGSWYDSGPGASGTVTILVDEQKVVVEHGWRIEEVDTVTAVL